MIRLVWYFPEEDSIILGFESQFFGLCQGVDWHRIELLGEL